MCEFRIPKLSHLFSSNNERSYNNSVWRTRLDFNAKYKPSLVSLGSEDISLCRQSRIEIYYHIDIFYHFIIIFYYFILLIFYLTKANTKQVQYVPPDSSKYILCLNGV